jgi:hypothetical protein
MPTSEFLCDAEIAQHLKVSKSCIRGQRYKRRHSHEHWLTIDPVFVGKCPRYVATDFYTWVNALEGIRATVVPNCNLAEGP